MGECSAGGHGAGVSRHVCSMADAGTGYVAESDGVRLGGTGQVGQMGGSWNLGDRGNLRLHRGCLCRQGPALGRARNSGSVVVSAL